MSYGKKDEDADQAIVKVDRTSVFQEGEIVGALSRLPKLIHTWQHDYSTPPRCRLEDVEYY